MSDDQIIPIFDQFDKVLSSLYQGSFWALADGSDVRMTFPPKATTILR